MLKKVANKFHWSELLLGTFIVAYIAYFSWFTILRFRNLYAHYFDLGIMHQTVYNTFKAIQGGDGSRFLEMTNPHGFDQVKRMSVHNDMLLAFLAPFYFIFSGPETLLEIQSIMLGLGALFVWGISMEVFKNVKYSRLVSLFFAISYLFYPPLQRANQFDFHAVTLATPLLLGMFYFALKQNWIPLIVTAILAVLSKEEVGLTVGFFGLYMLLFPQRPLAKTKRKTTMAIGITLFILGMVWFWFSMSKIIPHFRSGAHFAIQYFGDFGESPKDVLFGLLKKPSLVFQYIFRKDTFEYLQSLLSPVAYLSALAPMQFLISAPELAINLMSNNGAMRNVYFHYTSVITPFVYISAIYGLSNFLKRFKKMERYVWVLIALLIVNGFYWVLRYSPLPFSLSKEIIPVTVPRNEIADTEMWRAKLSDDSIRVMSSGRLAPHFASRRYFYNFSQRYDLADYIVLSPDDIYNGYQSEIAVPAYEKLIKDSRFNLVFKSGSIEVYKKIK